MSKEETPLRELFAKSITTRKARDKKEHQQAKAQRDAWVPESLAWNLKKVRQVAQEGGGFCQVTSINGTDAVHPAAVQYKDRYPELLNRLVEIGKAEGFEIIPSPLGVVPGWWIVWDREAWDGRDSR